VTPATAIDESRLTVGRWASTYVVARDHPDAEGLRRRLDDLVQTHVGAVCGQWLTYVADPADPSVWRIRTLNADLSLDAGFASADVVARKWGEHLATRVHHVLERPDDGDTVLRFSNRAAYLAQLVIDLAAGRAWDKWYYDEFQSLRGLTTSAAIREAMVGEQGLAASVVTHIDALHRTEEVLLALTVYDASRIYDACVGPATNQSSSVQQREWAGRLLESWNEDLRRWATGEENRAHDALRLLARIAGRFPGAESNENMHSSLNLLLDLRQALSSIRSPRVLDQIIRSAASGSLGQSVKLALEHGVIDPQKPLSFLAQIAEGDDHWATQAAAVLLGDQLREVTLVSQGNLDGDASASPFGGIFLLGPSFNEIDLHRLTLAATASCEDPASMAAILRHLVALQCLGRARADEAAADAAMRLFSGFRGRSLPAELQELGTAKLDLVSAQQLLRNVLRKSHRYDGRCLLAETVQIPSSAFHALIVRDVIQDEWLYGAVLSGELLNLNKAISEAVAAILETAARAPEVLLVLENVDMSENEVASPVGAIPIVRCNREDPAFCDELADKLNTSRAQVTRSLRLSRSDLEYFFLLNRWPDAVSNPALDLTLTLIARSILKHFARRILGFELSSPEHLYQNVLSGMSEITSSKEKIEVRLPRSPLSVVLRLCGLQNQIYRLPWLEGRELCLLPPAD
jgi:hypothetical protein